MSITIQLRRDSAANWTSVNPVLASGEAGFETDTGKLKVGNGATAWTGLSYITGGSGGGAVASVFTRTGTVAAQTGDYTVSQVTGAAPLASPALTGTPTVPTASPLTSTTQAASTAYADAAVAVEKSRAQTAEGLAAQKSANLSDLASASTARTNLGLGAAAVIGTPVSIANGGSGQATQQAAIDALAGAQTSGQYLRGNGTHVVMAGIQAGDVPTLNQSTSGNAATATNLAGGVTLPAYLAPAAVALTYGTSVAVNAALGNAFNLTLTASTATIANPTSPVDGQVIRIRLTQGSGGGFTVAWGAAYDFGAVGGAPVLSTTAGKVDVLAFEYVSSISKWCCLNSGGIGY